MNANYEVVIGLEVHAELSTGTKIYCSCKNEFGSMVNSHCCPTCLGLPGALPTLNEEVVDRAIKAGHAMNCSIHRVCKQDRKNYFYPDLPKGYQISQYDMPLCVDGYVDMIADESGATKRIGITRIHIEEDTGKLLHDESFDGTLIDFNRCGVPLIEIVSEPDLRSAQDAKIFLDTLRDILIAIGVTDGKMQEGSIRCDVNVSVRRAGDTHLNTRVEMKNVNTFNGAVRAIEYEAARQIALMEQGGEILQETRRWDDPQGKSFVLRSKEDAQDYRYFPEPDLRVIAVSQQRVEELKAQLPELPHKKTLRFMRDYSLSHYDANLLVENPDKADFFEACVRQGSCQGKNLANWILGDISRILNENGKVLADSSLLPEKLCIMVSLIEQETISTAAGKTVLEEIIFSDKTPEAVVQEKNLAQISDSSTLEEIARAVLEAHGTAVQQYKEGKTNVLGFLVGQCMKQSKGQGNPNVLKEIVLRLIEA